MPGHLKYRFMLLILIVCLIMLFAFVRGHRFALLSAVVVVALTSGCASHRVSSNIDSDIPAALPAGTKVLISEDALPGRKYKEVGPIEVCVRKLTAFHTDPTKEQANSALSEKACAIGADAVVDTRHKSGVGFTTWWGYLDANGTGVKLAD
ncbi:MAG TPA: hypothetical protein PLM62_16775 [Zoogloea sp.]|nr:hypothetical protein [Zoogloea sp.]